MSIAFQRTRIAPTPSGFLHLGNAYSFALTAALAEEAGASLLLRIDDADAPRVRNAYTEDIFEVLELLQIEPHEGPRSPEDLEGQWSQQHRLPLYEGALQALAAGGHVFACTCSRTNILAHSPDGSYPGTCLHKKLPLGTPGACWRLKPRWEEELELTGMDNRKSVLFLSSSMQHFIVRKKDGWPAYQLTSLVDDLHFRVDAVVRGEDLLPSTAAQLLLARLLEQPAFTAARFLHHPLLPGPDGKKLSKSAGATSLRQLRTTEAGRMQIAEVITQAQRMVMRVSTGK